LQFLRDSVSEVASAGEPTRVKKKRRAEARLLSMNVVL
jgi:hypothetical protein